MTVHEHLVPKATVDLRRSRSALLRWVLLIDGGAGVANGSAYLLAGSYFGAVLGLPTALLMPVGAFLLAYGAAVAVVSRKPEITRATALVIIALDALWALDSLFVAFGGWFEPTAVGVGWILVQAVAVAAVGAVKYVGLRRALS